MAEVAVIIPTYQNGRLIGAAIRSVLRQTFQDFQVYVVDDGSSDETEAVVVAFRDERIHYLQQPHLGVSAARNRAIRQGNEPIIALLDADDSWHPLKLERQLQHLRQNPRVGLSFTWSELIQHSGESFGVFQQPSCRPATVSSLLLRNPITNGSVVLLRRQALEDIALQGDGPPQYFDEAQRFMEDLDCWLRLALHGQWSIEGISDVLSTYRLSQRGSSANLKGMEEGHRRIFNLLEKRAPTLSRELAPRSRAYMLQYLAQRGLAIARDPHEQRHLLLAAWKAYPVLDRSDRFSVLAVGLYSLLQPGLPAWGQQALLRQIIEITGVVQRRQLDAQTLADLPSSHLER